MIVCGWCDFTLVCGIVQGVWWEGTDNLVCVLVLSRLCCFIGVVGGLPVCFRWPVTNSLRMGVPEEQDGAIVDMP